MSKHKKQHFIPRCYQKAWLDPTCPRKHEPYIWVLNKDTRESRKKAPGNIFHETDMYTITGVGGSRDLRIENGLSQLETDYAVILKKLCLRQNLEHDEWVVLCAFIAAMHSRTPTQREHLREQWSKPLKKMDDLAKQMKTATAEQIESMRSISDFSRSTTTDNRMTHDQVRERVKNPLQHSIYPMINAEVPYLTRMDFAVFNTETSPGFITSDYPVVWYDPEAYKRPPMHRVPALKYLTIEITMPISPKQCICLNRQGLSGYMDVPGEIVSQMNRCTVQFANEYVVVNQNQIDDDWFRIDEEPEDSWDKTHE